MLHQILEDIIKNHDYTIKRVAKITGLSEKTVRLIKSKKARKPRNQTIQKLLALYFALQYRETLQDPKTLDSFDRHYLNNLHQKKTTANSPLKVEEPKITYAIDTDPDSYKKFKFSPSLSKDFAKTPQPANIKHFLF